MKKKIIKQKENLPEFIIGISSQHHDFQVAWTINNALDRNLSKTKSISIKLKKNNISEIYSFTLFSYTDLDKNFFYLLSNKDEGAVLYPKYKNIDFFLIAKSEEYNIDSILKKISNNNFIIGSFKIPVNNTIKRIIERVFEN